MNKGWIRTLIPHLIAIGTFLVVALVFCRPALEGKVLQQPDVIQWRGMAQNSFEYKEKHGHFPLWTNSMFSGMPAYQIAMEPDVPVTPSWFYGIFSFYLPKPMSFFFTACLCFYFLALVLRINPYIGIMTALTYAYATYNPAYLAAGHDTKIMTIALLPGFVGALLLIYEGRYLWGAALTVIFTALMFGLNHMQIVYYGIIIAVFMTLGYAVHWMRQKQVKRMLMAVAIAVVAGIIGVLANAVTLLTTLDASKTTIRGGTELPDQNSTKEGLSKDYAFAYSMGISEPLVMMVPDMFGGSGKNILEKKENSKSLEALQSMPQQLSSQLQGVAVSYWGGIGPVPPAAPNYIGAITCFLALIGFFLLDGKHKWWILAASVVAILMSWGSYFDSFNSALLNILPGYNKFRVPSMIIIIPTILMIMMAGMSLQRIISATDKEDLWPAYKKGLMLTGGVVLLLLIIYFTSDYKASTDNDILSQASSQPQVLEYVRSVLNAAKEDRQSIFFGSLMRSLFLILAAAFMVWLRIKGKIKNTVLIAVLAVVSFFELIAVDTNYLSEENYQDKEEYDSNFPSTAADARIKTDTSYYRVFDLRQGFSTLTYGALTAYHHKSIGGYHPAKLSIYQDLIDHQLTRFNPQQLPSNVPVLNMLNTKYMIVPLQGGDSVMENTGNLGAAWFVKGIRKEADASSVMNALGNLDVKDTAVLFAKDANISIGNAGDSAASIRLVRNDNDVITYTSSSTGNGFAVFSEVYYDRGWKAYIDDREVPIVRTNYVLRGIAIPAGNHNIRFEFKPAAFYTGEKIALAAGIVMMLLLLAAIFQTWRERRNAKA